MNYISRIRRNRSKRLKKQQQPSSTSSASPYIRLSLNQFIPWLLILLVIIVLISAFNLPWLKIKRINCVYFEGDSCPEVIVKELDQVIGEHSLLFSTTDLKQKLLRAIPEAQEINIGVELPDQLNVQFTPNRILASVRTATNSGAIIISDNLTVLAVKDTAEPKSVEIQYPAAYSLTIGDRITDPALTFALDLIKQLKQGYLVIESIKISDPDQLLVKMSDNKIAVFSSNVDLTRQVNSLQSILSKAKINQDLPFVDVRFDQPVLKLHL